MKTYLMIIAIAIGTHGQMLKAVIVQLTQKATVAAVMKVLHEYALLLHVLGHIDVEGPAV
jgi:hypothetical protein